MIKVVTIWFPDSVDISGIVPEADASVSSGTVSVQGKVMLASAIAVPPSELGAQTILVTRGTLQIAPGP